MGRLSQQPEITYHYSDYESAFYLEELFDELFAEVDNATTGDEDEL